jgi:uncharacterized protein
MRILIDIGHPAHVHLFKNFAWEMGKRSHTVFFTCREKEFEIELLKSCGFNYKSFGRKYISKFGKIWGLCEFDIREFFTGIRFKPDLFLSAGSMYAAHAAFLLGKPHITFEDTGNTEQVRLYKPFTRTILTSTSFLKDYGKRQLYYYGFHELAYLHPKYFTPAKNILNELGVSEGEPYFILRFVSWNASHDIGHRGLSMDEKLKLLIMLKSYGKVFISSEKKLEAEFEKYRFNLPPWRMHDALAFCCMFIGEGATMASECAMLGTPAVYVNSIQAGSIDEQSQYGLLYHFNSGRDVLEKVKQLLLDKELKNKHQKFQEKMLSEKINVTDFLVWFVENYPESISIMKNDPDYQLKFK